MTRGKPKVGVDWDQVELATWSDGTFWSSRTPDGAAILLERRRKAPLFRRQPLERAGDVLIIWPAERRRVVEHAREVLARHVPPPETSGPGHTRFER